MPLARLCARLAEYIKKTLCRFLVLFMLHLVANGMLGYTTSVNKHRGAQMPIRKNVVHKAWPVGPRPVAPLCRLPTACAVHVMAVREPCGPVPFSATHFSLFAPRFSKTPTGGAGMHRQNLDTEATWVHAVHYFYMPHVCPAYSSAYNGTTRATHITKCSDGCTRP